MFCRQAQTACATSKRSAWRCGELASRAAPVTRRHLSSAVAASVSSAPRHGRPRVRGQLPQRHGQPFQGQSRHGDARTYAVVRNSQQQQQSSSEKAPRVAVIGAGLTGLTTAYYLARKLPPESSIVIFEASERVGGWLRSEKHSVRLNDVSANVLLERGPRMLSTARNFARNDRLVLFDLLTNHGLFAAVPRPLSRFIWHDRDSRLLDFPPKGLLGALVREPLFWTAGIPSIASYALKWLLKKPGSFPQDDVSVGDWLLAVTGSRSLVDDIASAGIHGIWGGDIYKLSAASVLGWTFQRARHPDVRHNDDVIPASEIEFVERFAEGRPEVYDIWQHARASTMCLGPFGLESLPAAIADTLKSAPNVQFSFNNRIRSIEYDGAQDQIKTMDGTGAIDHFDKAISTLPAQHLARITGDKLPTLKDSHSVSIMTVNLWYPFDNIVPSGLGYLIPSSTPRERNPERALGVFLDSEVGVGANPKTGPEPGTKLFVLLGGHYYDEPGASIPSEEEAIQQAKTLLERQLRIPRDLPCHAVASLAPECLPQHYVGHHRRMAAASNELEVGFNNRLAAIGGSYRSPGLLGAARAGYDIADSVAGRDFFDNGLQALTHDKVMNPEIAFVPPLWNTPPPTLPQQMYHRN